jgi:hypothetical protein
MYFSRANTMNAHTTRYQIVDEIPWSELKIFQWKGKGVGASIAHFAIAEEWNYTLLYMYTNMEEVKPYFDIFEKMYWRSHEQPTMKQLDNMCDHGRNSGSSFTK